MCHVVLSECLIEGMSLKVHVPVSVCFHFESIILVYCFSGFLITLLRVSLELSDVFNSNRFFLLIFQHSAPSVSQTAAAPAASGVDAKVVKELKDEIKSLKDNEKKMQKELKGLKEQLKDYDKLTADIKLLCDAVKKNDERIAALESLVSEESDEEGGGEE